MFRQKIMHNAGKLSTLEFDVERYMQADLAHSSDGLDVPVCRAARTQVPYNSSMCSTTVDRLARIGDAIDELAAQAASAGHAGQADDIADRLAQLWAMIADLDPELARRLPGYGS